MYYFVNCLKALACLLIVNFHSDILYPDKISIFAFGGDIGNNIFFMISGFTLYNSIRKCEMQEIHKWYLKRVKKIMPPLMFMYILSYAFQWIKVSTFSQFVAAYIFPGIYWFVVAIMILYVCIFIYGKIDSKKRNLIPILLVCVHLIIDNMWAERYFIGMLAMICGVEIAKKREELKIKKNVCFWGGMGVIGYLGMKILRMKGIECFGMIHLMIGLFTIVIGSALIFLGLKYEKRIKEQSEKHKKGYRFLKIISELTLYVYLVQVFDDRVILVLVKRYIAFPLSYILANICVFIIAYIIRSIENNLIRKGEKQ